MVQPCAWFVFVQPLQHFGRRRGAVEARKGAPVEELLLEVGLARVDGGSLVCLQCGVCPRVFELDLAERAVGGGERQIVIRGPEHRQRLVDQSCQTFCRALRFEGHVDDADLDPPAELAHPVAES